MHAAAGEAVLQVSAASPGYMTSCYAGEEEVAVAAAVV